MFEQNEEIKRLKKLLKKATDEQKQWAKAMIKYINKNIDNDGIETADGPGDVPPPPPPRK